MKTFIGGIGCFWDETKYEGIKGVISTECGYCGGDDPNVTYKAVCGGDTVSYTHLTLPTTPYV